MVKFKKRVARHKISGFLKNVPLILFFHGIDKNDFYKILNHFLITEKSNLLKTEKKSKALQCKDLDFLQKRNDSIPEIEKRIALQGQQWAEQVLRREDMTLYIFRLLLEYGRLGADERMDLGWVQDLM